MKRFWLGWLILAASVCAAAPLPIEVVYPVSGATVYVVRHAPDGTDFNDNTGAFEAYNQSHWSQYAVALTEQAGSFYYSAAQPAASTSTLCTDVAYLQAGGSPALGDIPIGTGQTAGANVFMINSRVSAAGNMAIASDTEVIGAAVSGTLTTRQMSTNLTNGLSNAYVGRTIVWTSGTLTGVSAGITAYNGTTKVISYTAVPTAPSVADTFIII